MIPLQIDITSPIRQPISINQFDADEPIFLIALRNGGLPIDLTGALVTFYAKKPDGHVLFNECIVTDATNGKCTYKVTTQTSAAAGTLKAQIVITWGSGAEKRSEEFDIKVKPSLDITNAVESTDEFTQLQQALALTTGYNTRITANTNNIIHDNILINSNFLINQLSVSGTVTLLAGQYGHDGWKAGAGGCTYTYSTVDGVTTITITAGTLKQVVEGCNILNGDHTLSWIGTALGQLNSGGYGTSPVTKELTGGNNAEVEFGTGTLFLPKLEKGDVATFYVPKSCAEDLRECQRHYEIVGIGVSGHAGSTNFISLNTIFRVKKRTTPTIELLTSTPTFADIPYSGDYTGSGSMLFGGYGTTADGIKYANVDGFSGLTTGKAYICFTDFIGVNARL
jgi:hypothetical protein